MINQQTHALNDLVNKSICALTLGCLVMSCADLAPGEYKAPIPSTEIIADEANRYEVELEAPETETNPAQDTALFDVELVSPLRTAPSAMASFQLRPRYQAVLNSQNLVVVAVEGVNGTQPLSLALDGTPTFEGEVDLRGVYEGDLVFPLVAVTVTDSTGASAQVSTRIFVDRTDSVFECVTPLASLPVMK